MKSPTEIILKQVKVIDPNSAFHNKKVDILVDNGVIKKISNKINPAKDQKLIEIDKSFVCPGLMDMSVDFQEPGNEQKETINSGVKAAAAGGFTAKTKWIDFLLSQNLNLEATFGVANIIGDGSWKIRADSLFGQFYKEKKGGRLKQDFYEYNPNDENSLIHKEFLGKIYDNITRPSIDKDSPFPEIDRLQKKMTIVFNDWQSEIAYRKEYGARGWAENKLMDYL